MTVPKNSKKKSSWIKTNLLLMYCTFASLFIVISAVAKISDLRDGIVQIAFLPVVLYLSGELIKSLRKKDKDEKDNRKNKSSLFYVAIFIILLSIGLSKVLGTKAPKSTTIDKQEQEPTIIKLNVEEETKGVAQ